MSSNGALWFRSLGKLNEETYRNLQRFECDKCVEELYSMICKNLHHYDNIFAPLRNNTDFKYQWYFFFTTLALYIHKITGGELKNEDDAYIRTMLVAFVDLIVDNPDFGIDTAYGVGLYIFKGINFNIPESLKKDTEHVKSIISRRKNKKDLLMFMLSLGEIEKKINKCNNLEEYVNLRLHSNCETMWDICEWVDDSVVYSFCTMGAVFDDILDMCTDKTVYINDENLSYYLDRIESCIQIIGYRTGYNLEQYSKIITIFLKAVSKYTFRGKENMLLAIRGLKLYILSLIVFFSIYIKTYLETRIRKSVRQI
jgi:hypothetical protein